MVSGAPANFISIASGNWTSPSTWNLNMVPVSTDASVTIAAGHTVTVDALQLATSNTTVNGTLVYGTTPSTFSVLGNLSVGAGGAVNVFNGTTGKDLVISGNLLNDGAVNASVGATTAGSLTFTGSAVQTISGAGAFTGNVIRNLIFLNTSTAIPNINWQFNNISVDYNLNITNAKINLGSNKLTFGTSATSVGNTFSIANGGFMAGGKFSRWYTSGGTGYTTGSPTSLPTATGGRYPFYNAAGMQRVFFIGRTTPTAGGTYAVTYNAGAGLASGFSIVDGAYTVTDRTNGNFVVTTEGNAPAETSDIITIFAPDAFYTATGVARIVGQSAALSGTHTNATTVPSSQRSAVTPADLTSATGIYLGVNTVDIAFVPVTSGNWNVAATWNKGTVPTCTDIVVIGNGFNVTVNSAANSAKGLTIGSGSTLTIASGDLTVGCTAFNNTFVNNGILTVTGGALNVNGSMTHNLGSTFNQSGGDVNVDGNDAGVSATSVAASTPIVSINTNLLNLTGGMLTIVDPHASSTATYTLSCNTPVANVDIVTGNHTLRFGNGTSTDAGGSSTYGFRMYTIAGSFRTSFNNIIVNGGAGTNRFVSTGTGFGANGDFTINAGSEYYDVAGFTTYIAGNLVNNGILTATNGGTVYMGTYLNATAGPSTKAQTISGSGVFRNNATTASVTANLLSLAINNTNAAGVTLSVPLSLSSTLTLTAGKLNTTNTNLITVGTATASGTVSGGSATAYVSGPLARTIGNTNTSYIVFPVGKAAYAPISLNPATTAVSVIKAEAFDTNTGTSDPSIINLAANRRWEAPLVSGTITALNVRLGDANITATKIPVMAPTAAGAYASSFGSVATYAAGTPNTTTSNTAITAANYTGFLSFADSNACSGTPAPGNTVASATNICQGTTVNFSVQNGTTGSGVTYQWQSSPDNATYTDIASATTTTYSVVPASSLYYRLKVTCSAGPSIGYSTPAQITFSNNITASTGATRCGTGNVTLNATPSAGAAVQWFDAISGGNYVGAGSAFTIPVTTTTTLYAGASAISTGVVTMGTGANLTTATETLTAFNNRFAGYRMQLLYTAAELNAAGLTAGNITSLAFNTTTIGDGATNQNYTIKMGALATATIPSTSFITAGLTTVYGPLTHTHTDSGWQVITLAAPYAWDGISNVLIEVSHNGADLTNNAITYYTPTTGFNRILYTSGLTLTSGTLSVNRLDVRFGGQTACGSARVPVTATVNVAPVLTLSGNPAIICSGQSSAAVTVTAGASDYDTYVWTPSTGVTGNAATGFVFNPAVTTTYTLQASNSTGTLCNAVPVSVTIQVNPLPSAIVSTPTVSVCENGSQALTATGGVVTSNIFQDNFDVLSTNFVTASTTGTAAATLNTTYAAQGAGSVLFTTSSTSANLSYNLNSNVNLSGYDGAQLTFSHIAIMEGSATSWDIGYVEYSADGGTTWTTFPASNYAGSGTLITTQGTATAVEGAIFSTKSYADWIAAFNSSSSLPVNGLWKTETINVPAAALTNQFRIRFRYTTDSSTNYYGWLIDNVAINGLKSNLVWSPATNLYTDAATTVPYTGQSLGTVYVKPTAATSYTVTSTNATTSCSRTANVNVTINVVAAPTVAAATQEFCNLGTVAGLTATGTAVKWYAAAADGAALAGTTALVNGTTYYGSQTVNGCESVARVALTATINVVAAPAIADDTQEFCNAGTVAELLPNDASIKWYSVATGGTALVATDALASGSYYASQTVNGCEGLVRGMVTVTVNVIAAPAIADDSQVFCNAATVADLQPATADIKWYTDATGGTALIATDALSSGTYYASQTVNGCEGLVRGAVAVTVNVTAVPTGDDEQEFCSAATVAELAATGDNITWYDAATDGNVVAVDAALVNGTVYYASQTIDGCEGLTRFAVTAVIHTVVVDAPANVSECTSYELPALTSGAYFTEAGGLGTEVAAGTAITETTTLYVYAQEGTDIVCSDENMFVVTIANIAAPTGDSPQTVSVNDAVDATIADLVVTAEGTVTWYASEADAAAGVSPLAADTQLTQGATYYATQTVDTCTSVDVLAVTVDVVLGDKGFDVKAFTFHPNPVKDVLNISYSTDITSVTVFNLLGQQVITLTPNSADVKLDMSSLADAAYIVNVTAGNTVKTIKVIKRQ